MGKLEMTGPDRYDNGAITLSHGREKRMNGEQGKWMAFTGDFKSQYGKGTDDDWQQIEGHDNENIGNVQERNCEKNTN
jgi:uncharacterized protein YjbJ (UPF0337 family)